MRIASWNVNSILVRLPRLLSWLEAESPGVVCLQETKVQDGKFPLEAIEQAGYRALFRGEKSYNGVAVLVHQSLPAPVLISDALPGLSYDNKAIDEARFLHVAVGDVGIASVYVPNGRELEAPHALYKKEFLAALGVVAARSVAGGEKLVLAGDFNVAPREADVHDPAHWAKGVLFHPSMRASLAALMDVGLADMLPRFHEAPGLYSWWDYRHLAFVKNRGLRIDLLLATFALAELGRDAGVMRDLRKGERPSDHVPVWADFAC